MGKKKNIKRLLVCLGGKRSAELAARLKSANNAEWQELLDLSRDHGVAPLLYFRLKSFPSETNIPSEIFEQLLQDYLKSAARNTLLYHELSGVLKALIDAGIPAILLKGAYLAECVYRDIALRPMQDIDILFRKEDLYKVQDKLVNLSYSPVKPIHTEFDITQHHHIPQFVGAVKIPIEVHWNITTPLGPYKVDINGLWNRALTTKLSDTNILALCPEDLLLHLCIHVSYHDAFQSDIRSVYDIKVVLEKFRVEFNWDKFVQRAFTWKAERCVYLTLVMVQNLLALELPEGVMEKLKPKDFFPKIISMAEDQLFQKDFENYEISSGLAQAWSAEKLGEKILLFLKRVFPSREELATKYPAPPWSPRIFLYYPVRIKDLFIRYGRGVLGLVKKDEAALGLTGHRQIGGELREWLSCKNSQK